MILYNITLKTPDGEYTIKCPDYAYILDAADTIEFLDEVVVNGGASSGGSGSSGGSNGEYFGSSGNGGSSSGGNGGGDSKQDKKSNNDDSCNKDILELALNINQNTFERLSDKYKDMAEQAEKNFNKNNKLSYNKAQDIFRKANSNPNYKLKKSDIPSIRNALNLDELKDIQRNANQISKAVGKAVLISDIYSFGDAIEKSIKQNDWRPLFDQTVSFGAGKVISIAFAFAVPISLPAIMSISAVSVLSSYFFRSEKIQEWREEFERNFQKRNNTINKAQNCNSK